MTHDPHPPNDSNTDDYGSGGAGEQGVNLNAYRLPRLSPMEWMKIGAYLFSSIRGHLDEGPISIEALLTETNAEGSVSCAVALLNAVGPNGLKLDFARYEEAGQEYASDDEIDVSEANFRRCELFLSENNMVTTDIAAILFNRTLGDDLSE